MKTLKIEVLLIISGIFVACNIYTLLPIYENIAASIDIKIDYVVKASSMFTLCYAIDLLIFGPLSDAIGRKKVIVIGMGISAVTTALVGLANTSSNLILFRGLQGFSLGSFAPVAFAYCYDLFSVKKRTLLLALINTGFLVAGIAGQIISTTISSWFTWDWTFYLFSGIYAILFLTSIFFLPNHKKINPTNNQNTVSIMLSLLKNRLLLLCYMIVLTLLFLFVAYYDIMNRSVQVDHHVLFWIRIFGLLGAILSIFTGSLIERLGSINTLFIGISLGSVSLMILLLSPNFIFLVLSSILFVAAISLLIPTIISLVAQFGGQHRAKALSLYSFFLLIGASIAPLIIATLSFSFGIILMICMLVIDGILAFVITRVSTKPVLMES